LRGKSKSADKEVRRKKRNAWERSNNILAQVRPSTVPGEKGGGGKSVCLVDKMKSSSEPDKRAHRENNGEKGK